jgi:hypothetical protein
MFNFDFKLNLKWLTPSPMLAPRSGIFKKTEMNVYLTLYIDTSLSGGKVEVGFNNSHPSVVSAWFKFDLPEVAKINLL